MIKVYVAGKYSADNVIDVLKNIGIGRKMCAMLFRMGYAPFCCWHDMAYIIDDPDFSFNVKMFYEYSIEWLSVSDCVLLLEGWEQSPGTLNEIKIAKSLNIPIYENLFDLAVNSKLLKIGV